MISHFPTLYPGELLYSGCARFGDRMRYPTSGALMTELMGNRYAVPGVDLPHMIDRLVSILPPSHNYTSEYLIEKHTLFPYFAPFAPVRNAERIRENMRGTDARVTVHLSGLLASRVTPPSFLRTCPACDAENIQKHGETFWHRVHQIAGVEVCPFHDVFLQDTPVRRLNPLKRHMFISAQRTERSTLIQRVDPNKKEHQALSRIAQLALEVIEDNFPARGHPELVRRYMQGLEERGYLTLGGMIRYQRLRHDFFEMFSPRFLTALQCKVRDGQQSWLKDIFCKKDRLVAPLRHLLLLLFLAETPESFFTKRSERRPEAAQTKVVPCFNKVCPHYKQDVAMAITRKHCKQRCVIFTIYCCPTCGQSSTRHDEGKRLKRVIAFGPLWEGQVRKLWADLSLGVTEIAKHLGAANATIIHHAARMNLAAPRIRPGRNSVISFKTKPRKPLAKYTTEGQRSRYLALRAAHPEKNGKQLCGLEPALISWLYKRDREWYFANAPRAPKQPVTGPIVDWDARDHVTRARVLQLAAKIKEEPGKPRRITIAALARELRARDAFYFNLDKLPLTRLAIQGVIETNEQIALRRIQYITNELIRTCRTVPRCVFLRLAGIRRERLLVPDISNAVDAALRVVGISPNCGDSPVAHAA